MTFLSSRKSKLFALLATVSLASLVFLYWQAKTEETSDLNWKGIQVGQDTKADVIAKLGIQPQAATTSAGGSEILFFPAENPSWPDEVYFAPDSDTSRLIKERVLNTTANKLQEYIEQYGESEAELASNDDLPALGFRLYIFPRSGIAVNAHKVNGAIFEIWYYPPSSLAEFQSKYASEITVWQDHQGY